MLWRHKELSDFVIKVEDAEIDVFLLNAAEKQLVAKLVKQLDELGAMKKNYNMMMQQFVAHEPISILYW